MFSSSRPLTALGAFSLCRVEASSSKGVLRICPRGRQDAFHAANSKRSSRWRIGSSNNETRGSESDAGPGSVTTETKKEGGGSSARADVDHTSSKEAASQQGSAGENGSSSSESNSSNSNSNSSSEVPSPKQPTQPATAQFQSISVSDLLGPEKVDPDDVKIFREKLCGLNTFFVTGQEPFGQSGEGVLLLGNLRGKKEEIYSKLKGGMASLFGEAKYQLFMVDEPVKESDSASFGLPLGPGEQGDRDQRVSFVLVRSEAVMDPSPGAWQFLIALALLVVTAGACLELGLATQISRVPPEVIKYFTDTNPQGDPPDLETLTPFVRDALPVAYGVLGVQLFHELGHFLVATQNKVKLGVPFLIPNITIGSFGSITNFRTPCPDRSAKFDISLAGPAAGGALSLVMFLSGLALSASASSDPAPVLGAENLEAGIQLLAAQDLVQVPSLLFQGSLLLGLLSRLALGYDALHAATVTIHPLLITGWCGLTATALNLLPAGSLDGGKATQAAFGRTSLMWTTTITYISLGLGLVGGTLSLPFGLYLLLLQRDFAKPALNDVTEVSPWRKVALVVVLLISLGILLPVWDELASSTGIGLESVGSVLEF